jgi:hypothetical protein
MYTHPSIDLHLHHELAFIRLCRRGKADSNNEECGNDVLPEDEPRLKL